MRVNLYRPIKGDVINYRGGVYRVASLGSGLDCFSGGAGVREAELEFIQTGTLTARELAALKGNPMRYLITVEVRTDGAIGEFRREEFIVDVPYAALHKDKPGASTLFDAWQAQHNNPRQYDSRGGAVLVKSLNMRPVRVTYDNGEKNATSINGTDSEIRAYYIGKTFNMGIGPEDRLAVAVSVEFLD